MFFSTEEREEQFLADFKRFVDAVAALAAPVQESETSVARKLQDQEDYLAELNNRTNQRIVERAQQQNTLAKIQMERAELREKGIMIEDAPQITG